jgi:5-methylcytosine-specific restriction endonuclease McrA
MAYKKDAKSGSIRMREWLLTPEGQEYKLRHREYQKQWREANREKFNASRKKSEEKIHFEALQQYGGDPPKCAACSSVEDLRLHPLNPSVTPYKLRALGWPAGYSVLCFACVRKRRSEWTKTNKPSLNRETGKYKNDTRETVPCSQCGGDVVRKRCHRKKGLYWCSTACMAKWKSENVRGAAHPSFKYPVKKYPCWQCGVDVERKPYQVRKSGRVFCSRSCCGKWKAANLIGDKIYNWEGGYEPYYGPSWLRAKRAARKRDDFTCQRCRKTQIELGRALDVHHIVRFREFGPERHLEANALSNLVSYCNRCHKIIEEQQKTLEPT